MRHLLFLFLFLSLSSASFAETLAPLTRDSVREEFKTAKTTRKIPKNLMARLEKEVLPQATADQAILVSYYGALKGLEARNAFTPVGKLSKMPVSLQWLDKAVEINPNDFEVRFVRLATLTQIPSFFIKNKHLEDIPVIIEALKRKDYSVVEPVTQQEMIDYLLKCRWVSEERRSALKKSR